MEKKAGKTTIGAKLLSILIPMVTVSIVFVIVFLSAQARGIIINLATSSLESDSGKNAANVGRINIGQYFLVILPIIKYFSL